MSILHLCNAFFEWELADLLPNSLNEAMNHHPVFRQLQFLPLIYANEGEGLLVSEKPKGPTHLDLYSFDESPPFTHLETWGYSLLAKKWADKKGIKYVMPPWDVVKKVNSKAYSFSKSPLPGARLIYEGDRIEKNTVLKSCFGMAGRGLILSENPRAVAFCKEQWQLDLPIISEPFVDRLIDFSTQWFITNSGKIVYLGVTLCQNSKTGKHLSNTAGMKSPLFLDEHKAVASVVLEEMAQLGYFGNVGIDAMLYGKQSLQPIVEINARKTMGFVVLMLKNKHPKSLVTLGYKPSKNKLLPELKISIQ